MFGLGFLAPLFLAGLAAIGVPLVLHLRRRRTDTVIEFPAAQMLPEAPVATRDRRRLRDLVLLALRVAALVLLAVSFARPYRIDGSGGLVDAITMVSVDVSMSASAPATWAAIVAAARTAVAAAPAVDRVGLATFDDRGHLVVPPSANRADVVSALDRLSPSFGGTSFAAGLRAAVDGMEGRRGRIVVVSDLQTRGWRGAEVAEVPTGVEISLVPVGPATTNLAVTALGRDTGVTAVIQNYAPGPRTVVARLRSGATVLATERVALAPLAAADVRFSAALPAAGAASVEIEDPDGFAGDNARFLLLEPPRPVEVLVLTADPPESATTGLYVERALEAASDLWPMRVTVEDGRRYSSTAGAREPGLVVVVGTRTLDRGGRNRLATYLARGGRVLLSLGPDIDVPTLGDAIGTPLDVRPDPVEPPADATALVVADGRHPIWRELAGSRSAFGRLAIARYREVTGEPDWTVLARFSGGAMALAERHVREGRLMVFASDLDNRWNRFPLEPAFAPFLAETARYLTRHTRSTTAFVLPEVPPGIPAVPGVHQRAAAGDQPATAVVVNVDASESDPAAMITEAFLARVRSTDQPAGGTPTDQVRRREAEQRWWQIGLLVMLAVLVLESVVGRTARRRAGPANQVG